MTMLYDLQPDDDFLVEDGLPCLRRDGKLYYLGDVQPRVLDACRRFGISFELLSEKLGMMRPALVLILKGYDAVPPNLKSMLDRMVVQAEQMQMEALAEEATPESEAIRSVEPVVEPVMEPTPAASAATVTIMSVPVPDAPCHDNGAADGLMMDEVIIPDVVSLDRPAAPGVPAVGFAPGLPAFTPGLRRTVRRRPASRPI